MFDVLLTGLTPSPDLPLLIVRLVTGFFFAISGWHKSFNKVRRAALAETFKADGCYSPVTMRLIPTAELLGGLAMVTGFLSVPAAIGLAFLCVGACVLDGFKRIPAMAPLDEADRLDDVLYLPEVLYIALLAVTALSGPGAWSLDHFIFA